MRKNVFQQFLFILILLPGFCCAEPLKISYLENYKPYSWQDENGNPNGLLIDWWNLWSQKTDQEITFIPGDVNDCIAQVESGNTDIMAGYYIDMDSTNSLLFSEFIIRLKTIVFLKKGIKPKSIYELEDTIGVIVGNMANDIFMRKFDGVPVKVFDSFDELKEKIDAKSISGFIYDVPNPFNTEIDELEIPGYYPYLEIHREKIRPAVRKGNDELLELIIKGSSNIADEELKELAVKWNLYKQKSSASNWLFIGGISGLLILLGIILISVKFRKKQHDLNSDQSTDGWLEIIKGGEGNNLEFKSSLRWDFRQEKVNKDLEKVIAKSICAFLNTKGGTLIIGVKDDGELLGLSKDYQSMSKKNSDGFLLAMANLINEYLGKKNHRFIDVTIHQINDKEFCAVKIKKSDEPVFLGKKGNEEFYIRASASSQPMSMSEAFEYIKSHWD